MKLSRRARAAILALSLLGSAATAARPAEVRERGGAPRLLLGAIGAPAPGLDPAPAARQALRDLASRSLAVVPAELGPAEVSPVGVGHVVRFPQRHRGLPVLGGEVVVRLGDDGRPLRLVRDVIEERPLAAIAAVPAVSAEAARLRVAELRRGQALPATLEIDLETERLVWVVPSYDLSRLENALYLVDAGTGTVLRRVERLRFADRFRVYRSNPAVSKAPETATLPGDDGGPLSPAAATPRLLSSDLLRASNCIDEATTREVPGVGAAHLCTPRQTAAGDGRGGYDALVPLIDDADGSCPTSEDANLNQFAEAHMYWHAAAAYDRFRQLFAGLRRPDFRLRPSRGQAPQPLGMVVNLCVPDFSRPADTGRPLRPLDNAFFSPGGAGGLNEALTGQSGDVLGFGMGRRTSFALDGDVIYHEFTHAVIFTLGRLTGSVTEDEHGPTTDPGAMNEGLADYFSSTITGDPEVGEYAWRNFSDEGGGLRSLANQDHCADQRIGEIHEDSKAFSGALWQARQAVAGDPAAGGAAAGRRDLFDQAVLAALDGAGSRPSMTAMAKLVLQELELRAGGLGAEARPRAEAAFTAHGLLPACDRVIRGTARKPTLCIDGTETRAGRRLIAGHVQWRIEVPATADTLSVDLKATEGACSGSGLGDAPEAPKLKLAVLAGEEPLTWQRDEGTQDRLVDLRRSGASFSAKVPLKGGVYHVMIVNAGGSVVGRDIDFALSCAAPAGCRAEEPKAPPAGAPGCGCRVGGEARDPGALALLGLGLVLLLGHRRRYCLR